MWVLGLKMVSNADQCTYLFCFHEFKNLTKFRILTSTSNNTLKNSSINSIDMNMIKQYSFVLIQLNDFHTGIKFITLMVKSDQVDMYKDMQRGISMNLCQKVVTIL